MYSYLVSKLEILVKLVYDRILFWYQPSTILNTTVNHIITLHKFHQIPFYLPILSIHSEILVLNCSRVKLSAAQQQSKIVLYHNKNIIFHSNSITLLFLFGVSKNNHCSNLQFFRHHLLLLL